MEKIFTDMAIIWQSIRNCQFEIWINTFFTQVKNEYKIKTDFV